MPLKLFRGLPFFIGRDDKLGTLAENRNTSTGLPFVKYSPSDRPFWKATFALTFASLYIFSSLYAVQPLLPILAKDYNITPVTSSLSLSLSVCALIAGLLILGFTSDRVGRVSVMKLGLFGSLIPLIFIPMVDSFILFLILRVIEGFFLAGIPAAAIAYLSEEVDKKSLGMAVSFYIASNALGGMGGRVFIGYLTDIFEWRTAFYFLGSISVIIIGLFFLLLPKSRHYTPSNGTFREDLLGMFVHLKNGRLLPLFLTGFMLMVVFTGLWTYLPFYLHGEPYHLSLKWISMTYLTYGFGVIGSPLAGRFSERLNVRTMLLIGVVVMIIGVVITIIHSPLVIVIGLSFLCLGFFIAHSMAAASVSQTATHHKGGASSFYLVSYYIGVAVGGTATGFLWTHFSWNGVVSLGGLLILLFVVLFQNGNK